MSSDLATIDLKTSSLQTDISASGHWSESFVKRPEMPWVTNMRVQLAGMLLANATSPATAAPDYWFVEGQRRGTLTAAWVEGVVGRRITRSEALRIAAQILQQAEQERLEFAAREAERGIQWEGGE
ncbi:MAG: hypothetical protein AB1555_15120 [Nitrospirota bacterium]